MQKYKKTQNPLLGNDIFYTFVHESILLPTLINLNN